MLYPVGTHIDLRYLNETKVEQAQAVEPVADREPRLYPVGTKILFLTYINDLTVLKITRPRAAMAV